MTIIIEAWGNGPQYCLIRRDRDNMNDHHSPRSQMLLSGEQQQAYVTAYQLIKAGRPAEEARTVLDPHFAKVQVREL